MPPGTGLCHEHTPAGSSKEPLSRAPPAGATCSPSASHSRDGLTATMAVCLLLIAAFGCLSSPCSFMCSSPSVILLPLHSLDPTKTLLLSPPALPYEHPTPLPSACSPLVQLYLGGGVWPSHPIHAGGMLCPKGSFTHWINGWTNHGQTSQALPCCIITCAMSPHF